jgi:heme oxygenase (mycobilin-producing)
MTEPVVLINAFEVPADQAEDFMAAWEETRDFLQSQPGYVDTALHQALTPGVDFLFINIARWETAEAFTAATGSAGFREPAAGLAGYVPHPGPYRIVRT